MSDSRGTWRAMSTGTRAAAIGGIVAVVVVIAVVAGLLARPVAQLATSGATPPLAAGGSAPALPPEPTVAPPASGSATPSPSPTIPGSDPLLGTDGRLTVLLLGSDYRPSHPGNRTDAIMVVSTDPTTGRTAGFSVPRDTVDFPLPTGGVYRAKVNALYQHLASTTGNAGNAMKQAVSRAFNIEIDRFVFIGFAGVRQLVGAVGGVDVTLDRPYYDAHYWVNAHTQGWGLPAGRSHLTPDNALIFARSRKGDNDFGRARRQQLLVMAALDKVRHQGIADVPRLIAIARGTVRTDLPLDRAEDLFKLFSTVNLGTVKQVVFGPRSYATGGAGGSFSLNLTACRQWIAKNFPPARPLGHWPATPAASGGPPPSPGASAAP
ncbi:MAG TPA: LCP family protein [Candidatus Limnocylindrales bacterium]